MEHTVSPRQETSVKRRRVFSDIINTGVQPPESHARRKSLSFDLVRISPSQTTKKAPANRQTTDMNNRGSGIPTLRNPDRYEKLLNISESLNRKCKVRCSDTPTFTNVSVSDANKQLTERLLAELEELEAEIRRASDDLAAIDDEYSHQNMLQRALKTEMAELNSVLKDHEAKFEYLLAQTTRAVELKQKELDVCLREYRTTLEDSYNNAKFQLENELQQLSVFEDTDTLNKLEKLKKEWQLLQDQLDKQQKQNEETLKELEQKHRLKLKEKEEVHEQMLRSADRELEKKEEALNSVILALKQAEELLSQEKQADAELKAQISAKKTLISDFAAVKADWQEQLCALNSKIRSLSQTEAALDLEIEQAKSAYDDQKQKVVQYHKTSRALEHSISKYGSNRRAFVRVHETLAVTHEDEVCSLKFDKVQAFSASGDFSLEWELHVQECLRGTLAALVFSGKNVNCTEKMTSVLTAIFSGVEALHNSFEFELFVQSVRIERTRLLDLLNRSNGLSMNIKDGTLDLVSQRMAIRGRNDISLAFQNISLTDKATFHIFTAAATPRGDTIPNEKGTGDSKKLSATLILVDLTKFSPLEQAALFDGEGANNEFNLLLKHIFTHNRCLTVCEVDNPNDASALVLLQAIHRSVNYNFSELK